MASSRRPLFRGWWMSQINGTVRLQTCYSASRVPHADRSARDRSSLLRFAVASCDCASHHRAGLSCDLVYDFLKLDGIGLAEPDEEDIVWANLCTDRVDGNERRKLQGVGEDAGRYRREGD